MAKSVATLQNVSAPAQAAAKPWPKQTEIDGIARNLDRLARYQDRLDTAIESSIQNQPLEGLQSVLDEFRHFGGADGLSAAEASLDALEPAEWRDEDWNIQTSAVSKMLAILVGSFPTSNLPDAAVFTRVMLDDVMALDPSFLDLEGACRKLRQTSKFMPSISELIVAIKAEKKSMVPTIRCARNGRRIAR